MSLTLFSHPFSSYCQKALIALYENGTTFVYRKVDGSDPTAFQELAALWPVKKFPLLVDDGHAVPEATSIIEHLAVHHPGPVRLIPDDREVGVEVRFVDRFFDNYIHTPLQKVVGDSLRKDGEHDPKGVAEARAMLDVAYGWLERRLANREWAAGGGFSLADCAAAPALFYVDWVYPIGEAFPNLRAYRNRLKARPSFARAVEEARPYRKIFPLRVPEGE